jgi:RNA polymerase sigma factor (sigma-70 family)
MEADSTGAIPLAAVARSGVGAETFERVVDRQAERLVRCLTATLLDREMAADAAQDAFIQLYRHWNEVTKTGSPDAWLYRVAFNRGEDYRRALARTGRLLQRLMSAAPALEEAVEWAPRGEFLDLLGQLSSRQRVAAALYYEADLSTADIGRVMGISEGAVNSHLHRARTVLKQMLEAR